MVILANVVLEDAAEWVIAGELLAIQPLGLFIIRSDVIIMISTFVSSIDHYMSSFKHFN